MRAILHKHRAGKSDEAEVAGSSKPTGKNTFPIGIKQLHSPDSAAVDLVFVHGLWGHREKTWTADGTSGGPWPQTLLPGKIPEARILTFGYDARPIDVLGMVSNNRVGNHARNLLAALATHREDDNTNDRPIIFIVHSLGGLVCEDVSDLSTSCYHGCRDSGTTRCSLEVLWLTSRLPTRLSAPSSYKQTDNPSAQKRKSSHSYWTEKFIVFG